MHNYLLSLEALLYNSFMFCTMYLQTTPLKPINFLFTKKKAGEEICSHRQITYIWHFPLSSHTHTHTHVFIHSFNIKFYFFYCECNKMITCVRMKHTKFNVFPLKNYFTSSEF